MSVTQFITWVILPLPSILAVIFLGIFFIKSRRKFGLSLICAGLAVIYLMHTPWLSNNLSALISIKSDVTELEKSNALAIVVLGCGINTGRPEYGKPQPSLCALERLSYASFLNKKLNVPILVSGGDPNQVGLSEAKVMSDALVDTFSTNATWQESTSNNTQENAKNSLEILAKENINNIILVTHAWHMKRALYSFEKIGVTVHPGSVAYTGSVGLSLMRLRSNEYSYEVAWRSLREMLGMIWYRYLY